MRDSKNRNVVFACDVNDGLQPSSRLACLVAISSDGAYDRIEDDHANIADLCHVLFNTNEFLYAD